MRNIIIFLLIIAWLIACGDAKKAAPPNQPLTAAPVPTYKVDNGKEMVAEGLLSAVFFLFKENFTVDDVQKVEKLAGELGKLQAKQEEIQPGIMEKLKPILARGEEIKKLAPVLMGEAQALGAQIGELTKKIASIDEELAAPNARLKEIEASLGRTDITEDERDKLLVEQKTLQEKIKIFTDEKTPLENQKSDLEKQAGAKQAELMGLDKEGKTLEAQGKEIGAPLLELESQFKTAWAELEKTVDLFPCQPTSVLIKFTEKTPEIEIKGWDPDVEECNKERILSTKGGEIRDASYEESGGILKFSVDISKDYFYSFSLTHMKTDSENKVIFQGSIKKKNVQTPDEPIRQGMARLSTSESKAK